MRYVPTAPSTAPTTAPSAVTPAIRRTMHDLHAAAGGRAWATRLGHPAPWALSGARATVAGDQADADRLVALLAALRAETTRYSCALRADGARPEQMLVRVKELVHHAMAAEGWRDPEASQALTAEVVRWSIAAYYDR